MSGNQDEAATGCMLLIGILAASVAGVVIFAKMAWAVFGQ